VKRFATLLAAGSLLASSAAFAEGEAEPAAEAASAATTTSAPVKAKVWKPAPKAVKAPTPAPETAPIAESAPAAPSAPPLVTAVAPVAPPVVPVKSAPPNQADWLRKDKAPAKPLATKDGPSPLRIGGMLLLVATLGGVAFYAKRKKQLPKASMPTGQLRVLGSTRVGPKASAVVVEIAGKRILLGVTEQSVMNLAWLDDDANAALETNEDTHLGARATSRARSVDDVAVAGPSGFLKLLRNAVGTGGSAKGAAVDEVARTTRDEVRISRRVEPTEELLEGQVAGLTKRRRDLP
jgi:flagellar biogenesis protein FliO